MSIVPNRPGYKLSPEAHEAVAAYDVGADFEHRRPGFWSECIVEKRDYGVSPWRIVHEPSVAENTYEYAADPTKVHRTGGEVPTWEIFDHWALGETIVPSRLWFSTKKGAVAYLKAMQERFAG